MMTKSPTNYAIINSVIVADSSPLISLSIIEQLEILPQLYQQILIPPAVWDEVTVQGVGLPGSALERLQNPGRRWTIEEIRKGQDLVED